MTGPLLTAALVTLGGALILLAVVDAVVTTLSAGGGAGPVTRRVTNVVWWVALRTAHGRPSLLMRVGGVGLLLSASLLWVVMLTAGWLLVFASDESAVLSATTGAPGDLWVRLYYTGFVVYTLGIGDYVPGTDAWRAATVLSTFSGLFLVTLSITYLISVVSAVVERRAFAASVSGLGSDPVEIVAQGWTGSAFSQSFQQHLVALSSQATTMAERHLAYPVLHYFVAKQPMVAGPVGMATLDDALLLLTVGVQPSARPDRSATAPLQSAIGRYLQTAVSVTPPRVPVPSLPSLSELAARGVPVVDQAEFDRAGADRSERRQQLAALVESNGWPAGQSPS